MGANAGHTDVVEPIDARLQAIAQQPFRARFHLRDRDRATAILRGPSAIRKQAHDLIAQRLAPAHPRNDGGSKGSSKAPSRFELL
jgi:hypothetical protein